MTQSICGLYLEDVHDELIEGSGWERCYHRERAEWHFNVKTGYGAAYRGFRDTIAKRPLADTNVLTELASGPDGIEDWKRRFWWESKLPDFLNDDVTGHPDDALIPGNRPGVGDYEAWSCGRSGGYVNVPNLESEPLLMAKLAKWLKGQRDYYNSREWGEYLAERALEDYDDELLAALASPRPQRIEA